MAQTVNRLPAMWETQVQSLGREDPLEKEMATHSSTLAWKIPWTEVPGGLQFIESQRVGHDDFTFTFKHYNVFYVFVLADRRDSKQELSCWPQRSKLSQCGEDYVGNL